MAQVKGIFAGEATAYVSKAFPVSYLKTEGMIIAMLISSTLPLLIKREIYLKIIH